MGVRDLRNRESDLHIRPGDAILRTADRRRFDELKKFHFQSVAGPTFGSDGGYALTVPKENDMALAAVKDYQTNFSKTGPGTYPRAITRKSTRGSIASKFMRSTPGSRRGLTPRIRSTSGP